MGNHYQIIDVGMIESKKKVVDSKTNSISQGQIKYIFG